MVSIHGKISPMTTRDEWKSNQVYERAWWRLCTNTFGEEVKQISYASRMGLESTPFDGEWPSYDLGGKSVIDIGGGPTSILLKTRNGGQLTVVDPCEYPDWVHDRYEFAKIDYVRAAGEDYSTKFVYDEAWIYNCLQHVMDPEKIISNMRGYAKLIRLFEWVGIPPHEGHPHELKPEVLQGWVGLNALGTVEDLKGENTCNATAFYGAFPT